MGSSYECHGRAGRFLGWFMINTDDLDMTNSPCYLEQKEGSAPPSQLMSVFVCIYEKCIQTAY